MHFQKTVLLTLFALTTFSASATAAIINQVDFPKVFTAKEKVVDTEHRAMTVVNTQK